MSNIERIKFDIKTYKISAGSNTLKIGGNNPLKNVIRLSENY